MHHYPLFLGLPVTESFNQALSQLSPALLSTFVNDQSSDYLQRIESEGVTYLGKGMSPPYDMAELESLQINVISLLKKLVPDYPYEDHPLLILALSSAQS